MPRDFTEPTIEFTSQGYHPDPYVLECGTTLAVRGVYNISGTAIHGTQGMVRPAGRVTPSNSSIETSLDGAPPMEEAKIRPDMRTVQTYARHVGSLLLGFEPTVSFHNSIGINAAAWYGSGTLTFNVARLGYRWFSESDQATIDALLLHEFAHERAHNHLDHSFHDECCRLGAKLAKEARQGNVRTLAALRANELVLA